MVSTISIQRVCGGIWRGGIEGKCVMSHGRTERHFELLLLELRKGNVTQIFWPPSLTVSSKRKGVGLSPHFDTLFILNLFRLITGYSTLYHSLHRMIFVPAFLSQPMVLVSYQHQWSIGKHLDPVFLNFVLLHFLCIAVGINISIRLIHYVLSRFLFVFDFLSISPFVQVSFLIFRKLVRGVIPNQ